MKKVLRNLLVYILVLTFVFSCVSPALAAYEDEGDSVGDTLFAEIAGSSDGDEFHSDDGTDPISIEANSHEGGFEVGEIDETEEYQPTGNSTDNSVDSLEDFYFAPDRVLVRLANTGAMQAFSASSSGLPDLGIEFSESRLLNPADNSLSGGFSIDSATDGKNNVYVLTLAETGKDAVENALAILNANPAVDIAEPDFLYELIKTPNDPFFNVQYALQRINAQQAWEITTGSKNIVVGVIDSGIDGTHPDLIANLWVNPNPGLGSYVNDIHGYCFTGIGNNGTPVGGIPTDRNGHGTHVAGIIGAKGDNGIGITGINWDVSLAWLGIDFGGGFVSVSAAIEALNYANLHNIPITNNSWGGSAFSQLLYDAVRDYRGLFVAAAGNWNLSNDIFPSYPASFGLPNIISVASTDVSDRRSGFSNFGVNSVHIAAPGSDIASTFLDNTYRSLSGTSMASPYVAGVAALMLAVNPDLSPEFIKEILLDTARHPNTLAQYGFGIVDAGAAIQHVVDADTIVNITQEMTLGQIQTIIDTAIEDNDFVTIGGSNTGLFSGLNIIVPGNKTVVWNARFEVNTANAALNINGEGSFTVGRIGSIINKGTGTAININSALLEVNIVGGIVRAGEGFAITGSTLPIRQNVPVNLDRGIVFAYGPNTNSVIHSDHIVITGNGGVVIAWNHIAGQARYERDSTLHLSSNPDLAISGVRWCANQQGIVNNLNASVITISDVQVAHPETVVLVQTMSAAQIQDSINRALRDNDIVTVTGSRVGLTTEWDLIIPAGKTLIWKAEHVSSISLLITGGGILRVDGGLFSSSNPHSTIDIWSSTALEVTGGGTVANTGTGTTIRIFGSSNGITVSSGVIRSELGFAIYSGTTNGREAPVNITGGVVFSHGTSTTGTVASSSVIHSEQNLNVSGSGVVIAWNRAEGITQYVSNTATHLVSDPELSESGVRWCLFAQGIVNDKNNVVIRNVDATVVEESDIVNIFQALNAAQIASAIHYALINNDVVTVTGSRINMSTGLNLTIPENKTVVFKAEYVANSTASFNVIGDGAFVITDGGSITNMGSGSALAAGGTVRVDISIDGLVANTGTGHAISISAGAVRGIYVTGGFVHAGRGQAIISTAGARDVPINIVDGIVFAHGASIAGIDFVTSVIRPENPLTVGDKGVIIAWNQEMGRIRYSDETSVHLVSNPSVDLSGVKWCYVEKGIVNARNDIVIKPAGVTVTDGSYINPVITQEMTGWEIQLAIRDALEDSETVTVTGSRTDLISGLWLYIPAGRTLIWKAELNALATRAAIDIDGEGTFEVAEGGVISNIGIGTAINIGDRTIKAINITGGTVRARQGLAITYHWGEHVPVNITGGVVFAHGTSSESVINSRISYTVSGNGMVIAWNQARGQTEYINNSTTHLVSNPSLSSIGIKWNHDVQGIINNRNNVVIKIDNISVVNEPFIPVSDIVVLNQSMTIQETLNAINDALEDNETVIVTGSRVGANFNLFIPDNKKIVWRAESSSLTISGVGAFEVAEGASISSTGTTSAILVSSALSYVNITGGTIRAESGFAISGSLIPVNITGGVVFAHGTSITGTVASSNVINSNIPLSIGGTGVIIAWYQHMERDLYENNSTLHLISSPALNESGVNWSFTRQGIVNNKNGEVVRISGVSVTNATIPPHSPDVTITQTMTVADIRNLIHRALDDNDIVTVTGSRTGVTTGFNLTIPAGKTVIWEAVYSTNSWNGFVLRGDGTLRIANDGSIANTDTVNAINVTGSVTLDVASGGLIANTGTGNAISIESSTVAGLNITGGTVRAGAGFAITSNWDGRNIPVNISSGVVFAHGTTITGSGAASNVINNTNPLNVGSAGVAIAWNHEIGWARYVDNEAQHLVSNPGLSESGVRWCFAAQGIANSRNSNVIRLNGVSVTEQPISFPDTINLVSSMTASDIQIAIHESLADNDIVTVTGSRSGVTLSINIPAGKTVRWKAVHSATQASGAAFTVNGSGTLEVADGGSITNSILSNTIGHSLAVNGGVTINIAKGGSVSRNGLGNAVLINSSTVTGINVTGGTVHSTVGYAITGSSVAIMQAVPVTVSGGVVFAHGSSLSGAVASTSVINNDISVTVSGTGIVMAWNQAIGRTRYANNTSQHIITNPALPVSGAKWCSVEQGIVNVLNSNIIRISGVGVTEAYEISDNIVNITSSMTIAQIQNEIHKSLDDHSTVTVTGSYSGWDSLSLSIPWSTTLIWEAAFTSTNTSSPALSITGSGSLEIAGGGSIITTGWEAAIYVNSFITGINITGGMVSARQGFAITGTTSLIRGAVPVNIIEGVVFAFGTSTEGANDSVVHIGHPLIIGSAGIVIAWNQAAGQTRYLNNTNLHLVSNPALTVSDVKWCIDEQAITNGRNDYAVYIPSVGVTNATGRVPSEINITPDMTAQRVSEDIRKALADHDIVTVTGSSTAIFSAPWFSIPANKTLMWKAEHISTDWNSFTVAGAGTFTIAEGGSIICTGPGVALSVGETINLDVTYGGLVANTGTGSAISVTASTVPSVHITGGVVRAQSGYAITSTWSANVSTPINVSAGLVFAYGNSITGTSASMSVISSNHPLTVSDTGVVIGWSSWLGRTEYSNNTSTHLVSSPEISVSGVKWCFNKQGVVNGLNDLVIELNGISVTEAANPNPVITQDMTAAEIQSIINISLDDNETVTVTGSRNGLSTGINISIPFGKTLIWKAEISSSVSSGPTIAITGSGTFEVDDGGYIRNTSSGGAIMINSVSVERVNVKGGSLRAEWGFAITGNTTMVSQAVPVNISGGIVFAHGTSATGAISSTSVVNSEHPLTISGTGVIIAWNQAQGRLQYEDETTLHLASNPALVTSGVKWCIDAQGIINNRNGNVIQIAGVTVTAQAWPIPGAIIDFSNERLTGLVANAAYTVNGVSNIADASGHISINTAWMGTTVSIIRTASDGRLASVAQNLAIPARHLIPAAVIDFANERFTGLVANAFYSVNGLSRTANAGGHINIDAAWIGTTVNIIRIASGSNFASTAQELAIPERHTTPGATINYINMRLEGLVANATYTINGLSRTSNAVGQINIDTMWIGTTLDIIRTASGSSFGSTMQNLWIPTRLPAPAATIDFTNEHLVGLVANATYTVNGVSRTADASGYISIDATWIGMTVSIIREAYGSNFSSTAQSLTIPARHLIPAAVIDFANERFTGLVANAFYTVNGLSRTANAGGHINIDAAWIGTTVNIIRIASGSNFASTAQELAIPERHTTPAATIDYINMRLEGLVANADYFINFVSRTANGSGHIIIDDAWIGISVNILQRASSSGFSSTTQELSIPPRPATTPVVTAIQPTAINGTGGISGTTTAMEYRLGTTGGWTHCTSPNTTGLQPGTYQVRFRATAIDFASVPTSVTIINVTTVTELITLLSANTTMSDPDSVKTTVEIIRGLNTRDVAAAKANPAVFDALEQLEEAHEYHNKISLEKYVNADKVNIFGFNRYDVTIIGAGKNATDGVVTFRLTHPQRDIAVRSVYNNATRVSMTLEGNGVNAGNLSVPVTITMPVPEGIEASRFRILHYHAGGGTNNYDMIVPRITGSGTDATATFTLTRFSEFAFVEIMPSTAPQNFNATPGNAQVSLTWTAPANNGGAAITNYQVSRDNWVTWVAVSATSTAHTFTGLTNGVTYTFRIRAVNAAGNGAEAIVTATPVAPSAPPGGSTPPNGSEPPGGSTPPPTGNLWNAPLSNNRFRDVPNDNWQNVAVSWADRNGITTGSPANSNTFKPNDTVTRAEFVTFLHRIYGSPGAARAPFRDLPANPAFQNAISWALAEGITTGSPAGSSTFMPNANITREQIAAMLYRYVGGGIPAPVDRLDGYTDEHRISTWAGAREAVNWAAYHGIMGRNVTELNPRGNATRAEAVTMLYRVVELFEIPAP